MKSETTTKPAVGAVAGLPTGEKEVPVHELKEKIEKLLPEIVKKEKTNIFYDCDLADLLAEMIIAETAKIAESEDEIEELSELICNEILYETDLIRRYVDEGGDIVVICFKPDCEPNWIIYRGSNIIATECLEDVPDYSFIVSLKNRIAINRHVDGDELIIGRDEILRVAKEINEQLRRFLEVAL